MYWGQSFPGLFFRFIYFADNGTLSPSLTSNNPLILLVRCLSVFAYFVTNSRLLTIVYIVPINNHQLQASVLIIPQYLLVFVVHDHIQPPIVFCQYETVAQH